MVRSDGRLEPSSELLEDEGRKSLEKMTLVTHSGRIRASLEGCRIAWHESQPHQASLEDVGKNSCLVISHLAQLCGQKDGGVLPFWGCWEDEARNASQEASLLSEKHGENHAIRHIHGPGPGTAPHHFP